MLDPQSDTNDSEPDNVLRLQCSNYLPRILTSVYDFRRNDYFTDVTLVCDYRRPRRRKGLSNLAQYRAHKIFLCVASPFFRDLLIDNPCPQPTLLLKGIYSDDLERVLDFIYKGEVFVSKSELNGFFETATYLEVFDFNDETKGTSISQTVTSVKRNFSGSKYSTLNYTLSSDNENDSDGNYSIESRSKRLKRRKFALAATSKKSKTLAEPESGEPDSLECGRCKLKLWSVSARKQHEEIHRSITLCSQCGKDLVHPLLLKDHLKTHIENEVEDPDEVVETEKKMFFDTETPEQNFSHVIMDPSEGIQIIVTDNSTLDNPEQKVDDPLRVTKAVPIITEMMDVLSSEDAYFILKSNDDLFTEGEKTLPVRAKAGEVYAFKCESMVTVKKHLRADGYMWKNKRTQYLPDDIMLKTYFYARTDEGITHDFVKHEYMLKDASRVLIHYLGDEKAYKDRKHGNCRKSNAYFYRTSKLVTDRVIEKVKENINSKPLEVYEDLMATDPSGSEGYLSVVTKPRNQQQISNIMSRTRKMTRDPNSQLSDDTGGTS